MYNKILVPVDGSETSKLGLLEAVKLAKSNGGQLRVVHVANEFILDSTGINFTVDLIESLRNAGKIILSETQSLVKSHGLEAQSVLLESVGGSAADIIIAQAKEWPADIIVMGTHGRRGIRRLALGSDAELVIRSTPVPVLLVRNSKK